MQNVNTQHSLTAFCTIDSASFNHTGELLSNQGQVTNGGKSLDSSLSMAVYIRIPRMHLLDSRALDGMEHLLLCVFICELPARQFQQFIGVTLNLSL